MGTTPNNEEQLALQLINRARSDPQAEMRRLFETDDLYIYGALRFFEVDQSVAEAQVVGRPAVAPLAWNTELAAAADKHNNLMIELDRQTHQAPGEPALRDRVLNEGYDFRSVGENVFAYSENVLHSHAGYYIDWGNGPDGIQSPPGHRWNMLNEAFVHVGIAWAEDDNKTTIGPYVSTQNFGRLPEWKAEGQLVNILGVAINDTDNDDFYDIGEGLAGISVTAIGGGRTYSTTTWSSGGYALEVEPNTTYSLLFNGEALGGNQFRQVIVGTQNVEIDVEATGAPPIGTNGDDFEAGTPTNDVVDLLGGNDRFFAGDGNDEVDGGPGDDRIFGDAGEDTLRGGTGNDRVAGGNDDDLINGGDGIDTLSGGNGADTLTADAGDDKVYGGADNDILVGGNGNDALFGDDGNDTLSGNDGDDRLFGGQGNDVLMGQGGADTLGGGVGDDYLIGGSGNSKFYGDSGNDTISGNDGVDVVTAGDGDDLVGTGAGNDRVVAQAGNDTVTAGNGNDQVNGGAGNDQLTGGADNDRLIGGSGNDRLQADSGNDTLFGGTGNDTLLGGADNDRLEGGAGNDIMTGGAGADTFILEHSGDASDGDVDTITDLHFSRDSLIIRGFGDNGTTTIRSLSELFALDLDGLTISDAGADTRLTFNDTPTTSHTVILTGIDDPLTIG